jgi:hypothetical protein
MAERRDLTAMTPLENDLRALGNAIAYPAPTAGFASAIQARLEQEPAPAPGAAWWRRLAEALRGDRRAVGRPVRRALVLALILLVVVAAIAAALGLGVPGIRILLGPSSSSSPTISAGSSPSASPAPRGSFPAGASLGLGKLTPYDEVETATGFRPLLPADLEQPAAAYVIDRRLTLVWRPSRGLPQILAPGVGLIVTEFDGRVDTGYYTKMANSGTVVEAVTVGGRRGYWLAGEPHPLWYVDETGTQIEEPPRLVGQALIWADDKLTYRLETSLPRDEAIRLAESMR